MKDGMKLKDFKAVWDMLTHQADITPDLQHWYYFQLKLPIKLYSELQRLDITKYEQGCAEAHKYDAILNRANYKINNFEEYWNNEGEAKAQLEIEKTETDQINFMTKFE